MSASTHACIYTHAHVFIHAGPAERSCPHSCMHVGCLALHVCINAHCAYMHTRMHTHTHSHTHTHIHTHSSQRHACAQGTSTRARGCMCVHISAGVQVCTCARASPQDPSVMSASLCALHDAIKVDSRPYKNLLPSFASILKQVSTRRGPQWRWVSTQLA